MFARMYVELHVSDCESAAHFFEDTLGFRRGYTLVEGGVLDFVVMEHPESSSDILLHHMLPAQESAQPRRVRLYFEPRDIHALCRSLRSKGYAVTEPERTDYGSTTAHLDGPDGYPVWFQQWDAAPKS